MSNINPNNLTAAIPGRKEKITLGIISLATAVAAYYGWRLFWFLTDGTNASSVLQATLNAPVYVLIVTVGVTLLSLAYRHFVWRQDIAASPSA